jgi:hypothetical protein
MAWLQKGDVVEYRPSGFLSALKSIRLTVGYPYKVADVNPATNQIAIGEGPNRHWYNWEHFILVLRANQPTSDQPKLPTQDDINKMSLEDLIALQNVGIQAYNKLVEKIHEAAYIKEKRHFALEGQYLGLGGWRVSSDGLAIQIGCEKFNGPSLKEALRILLVDCHSEASLVDHVEPLKATRYGIKFKNYAVLNWENSMKLYDALKEYFE